MDKSKLTLTFLILMLLCSCVGAEEINDLVPAIIQVESSGRTDAYNSKTQARGLMQITPVVFTEWRWTYEKRHAGKTISSSMIEIVDEFNLTLQSLYDPNINKMIGTWYLKRLRDHYLKDIEITFTGTNKKHTYFAHIWKCKNGELKTLLCQDIPLKNFPSKLITSNGFFDVPKVRKDYKLALILGAYNWGIGNVRRVNYDYNKFPKSVKRYIKKVLRLSNAKKNAL